MEVGAHGDCGVGIDGAVAFFDVADDALFIDDDVGALRPLELLALNVVGFQNAVSSEHFVVHVAKERKLYVDLLGKGRVRGGAIDADSKDIRIRCVDFTRGDSSLDRLKLFRSTAGEGKDVDGEKDVFLAAQVTELYGRVLIADKCEIRSNVTHFQRHLCHFWLLHLLRQRSNHGHSSEQNH